MSESYLQNTVVLFFPDTVYVCVSVGVYRMAECTNTHTHIQKEVCQQ